MDMLRLFFSPIILLCKRLLLAMPYWVLLLMALYLVSNIQILPPDERALIFRFGALQHRNSPQVVQGPGLIFAFPPPIDRVFRYPAQKVYSLSVDDLHVPRSPTGGFLTSKALDPEKVGYVLSSDHNLLHVRLALRYRIALPEQYFVRYAAPQKMLRSLILSSTVSQSGQRDIDALLTAGREKWVERIQQELEDRIEEQNIGVDVVSLEVLDVQVPNSVRTDFQSVQSAAVNAQTQEQEAKAYQAQQLPKAKSWANKEVNTATEFSLSTIAKANAEVAQLQAWEKEDSGLLQSRLYRERLRKIFSDIGSVRFVPPPKNDGMRITITEGK